MVVNNTEFLQQLGKYLQIDGGESVNAQNANMPIDNAGFGTTAISLAKQCREPQFGKTAEDEALVRQWIEYAVCYANYVDAAQTSRQLLKELNAVLSTKAYFVGNSRTLADACLYYVLYNTMVVAVAIIGTDDGCDQMSKRVLSQLVLTTSNNSNTYSLRNFVKLFTPFFSFIQLAVLLETV